MKKPIVIAGIVLLVILAGLALAVRSMLSGDRIKAAIEAQATAALGRPVTIQTATPSLFPRVGLELAGVAIGKSREVAIDRSRLTTGLRALFGRRVEGANVLVQRGRIDVPWALALLTALANSNAGDAPAPSSSALTIESIDDIDLRDITLAAGKYALVVEVDSSLTGDRFVINRLRGRSPGSDITASGELTSIARRVGRFSIDADTLDLDGLLAFLAAATSAGSKQLTTQGAARPPASATASPLNVTASVRARSGRLLGASFSNLTTSPRLAGSDAMLEDLRVELFGGRFTGSVAFRGSQAEPRYEWKGTAENLDVPQLVAFAGATGSITGKLGGTVALAAAGADSQAAMRRARGTARIAIRDGRIPGLEIVRTVILAFGKPSSERPAGSGEAFTRLAATLAVAGQLLSTNDLSFESRDFDMTGRGTISLATQAVDFSVDVRLSRELSAQAGRDLYRAAREGDRIVLPARITGTVAAPSVFIDVQSALKRAIVNRAQDEIKSFLNRLRKPK
jgi:uncharacterized protein involved in outer membrane biogenesis